MTSWRSGYAGDCKSHEPEFDSRRCLQIAYTQVRNWVSAEVSLYEIKRRHAIG